MIDLHGKAPLELVELVPHFLDDIKPIAQALEPLPPCEKTSEWIQGAYEDGTFEAWLTALLLGQNGHPSGYDTAHQILVAGKRSLSEGYAAMAMVQMDPTRARHDLEQRLQDGVSRRIRDAAASGLAHLGGPGVLDLLVEALSEGQNVPNGNVLEPLVTTSGVLLTLLDDQSEPIARAAIELVAKAEWRERHTELLGPANRKAIEGALARVKVNPTIRREIRAFLDDILDSA